MFQSAPLLADPLSLSVLAKNGSFLLPFWPTLLARYTLKLKVKIKTYNNISHLWPLPWHPDDLGPTVGQDTCPHLLGPLAVAAPGDIRGLRVHPGVEINSVTRDCPLLQTVVTRMGALKCRYIMMCTFVCFALFGGNGRHLREGFKKKKVGIFPKGGRAFRSGLCFPLLFNYF